MLRPARGPRVYALLAAVLVAGQTGAARGDGPVPRGNIDPRLGPAFQSVLSKAAARLQIPECASVIGDFDDSATGRPLAERLAETGRTASEFFSGRLTFTSGLGLPPCEHSEVVAFTSPLRRTVYVCRDQFRTLQRRDEGRAVNILIHEALHSLGLGENPPDSKVITARIQHRCGR